MNETVERDDFALLAVIDAYKWWIVSDYGFLQATGILDPKGNLTDARAGKIDHDAMQRITRAYGVARNIPKGERDRVLGWLDFSNFRDIAEQPFAERAASLAKFCSDNTVKVGNEDTGRTLASALSKLSWFMGPNDWTVFDKYVGAAVLRKQGAGCSQMQAFYSSITADWPPVSQAICAAAEGVKFNPLLGLRIIDKYLFCHGLGMYDEVETSDGGYKQKFLPHADTNTKLTRPSVRRHRASLMATEQALNPYLGDRLHELAAAVRPILDSTNWTEVNDS